MKKVDNMIIYILSFLDILSGIWYFLDISFFTFTFGIVIFIKGMLSLISAILSRYYYDWMGLLDILSGICIILKSLSYKSQIGDIIITLLIIKGIYSFIRHLLKI